MTSTLISSSSRIFSPFARLTIEDVVTIARDNLSMQPINDENARENGEYASLEHLRASAAWVEASICEIEENARNGLDPSAYYGFNTGLGDNAGRGKFNRVEDATRLSRNTLLSHAAGVGPHLPEDIVRAALAIRIANLVRGYSGVRVEVINILIEMLNRRVYPAVPSQGSLGASGDVAPLAHLFLPMSAPMPDEDPDMPGASGYCYLNGKLVTGREAMKAAGIEPILLGAKEGLALTNNTTISTAIATLVLYDAKQLMATAHIALAMTVEAMRGFTDAFLPYINRLRGKFQEAAAATILEYLQGSTLIRGTKDKDLAVEDTPPQDPYSIRCASVVLGAVASTLKHVEEVVDNELNSVADNPLIFLSEDPQSPDYLPRNMKMVSGGNFHGEPIALVMDFLSIAISELASIAERRVFLLTDDKFNRDLPPFLVAEPPGRVGLNNGLMIIQYTAASLVSENKSLAHPASVDSIPSSAGREDHVSMSTIAARQATQVVANAQHVIAIELLCASQALSLRLEQYPDKNPGHGTQRALDFVRQLEIAPGRSLNVIRKDSPLIPYVDALVRVVRSGGLARYCDSGIRDNDFEPGEG